MVNRGVGAMGGHVGRVRLTKAFWLAASGIPDIPGIDPGQSRDAVEVAVGSDDLGEAVFQGSRRVDGISSAEACLFDEVDHPVKHDAVELVAMEESPDGA